MGLFVVCVSMSLAPVPYEVEEVVSIGRESFDEYHIYSEVCALQGSDGLYGVMVLVTGNSLSDRLKRVLSFREDVPESIIEGEFTETTEKGIDVAMRVREELRNDARRYIEDELK